MFSKTRNQKASSCLRSSTARSRSCNDQPHLSPGKLVGLLSMHWEGDQDLIKRCRQAEIPENHLPCILLLREE